VYDKTSRKTSLWWKKHIPLQLLAYTKNNMLHKGKELTTKKPEQYINLSRFFPAGLFFIFFYLWIYILNQP
jgi:hypothetical protein